MKNIIRIIIGLIITCVLAGLVMGGVFTLTHEKKQENEHLRFQETMLGLLGFGKGNPAPQDLRFVSIYRYTLEDPKDPERKDLGYIVPVFKDGKEVFKLLIMSQEGEFKKALDLNLAMDKAMEEQERQKALEQTLGKGVKLSFGDAIILAKKGNERIAFLLPGRFPGFKTVIKVMLALSPEYTIKGLEIMEHEEDPGLGGEITQDYFKNQFVGKPFSKLVELKVVKEPLPDEYRKVLEATRGHVSSEQEKALSQYKDREIYALTGATISSRAVTEGVKNIVRNFAYRFQNLEKVLASQGLNPAF